MQWRIYYDDGSTFDDSMGGPEDAPAEGVFSIIQTLDCDHHGPYELLKREAGLHGDDWYWWRPDEGRWYSGDMFGLLDAVKHLGATHAKEGRTVNHARYEELIDRVGHDADFTVQ